MRMGLAANRLHHAEPTAALFRWLHASGAGLRELGVELHAVGRTHDAIAASGLLAGYPGLHAYPYGRNGGLMKLVAEVVGLDAPGRTLDGAIYLIDPVDPSSIFPEAVALKRQCVIHGKPFVSTVATARDWVECERIHAGYAPDPGADDLFDFESQTLALIAHDARKPQMLSYAAAHFDVLSRFASAPAPPASSSTNWHGAAAGRASANGCGATTAARSAAMRRSPTACWKAAASAPCSSRTRTWHASTRPTSSCSNVPSPPSPTAPSASPRRRWPNAGWRPRAGARAGTAAELVGR